MQPSANMKPRAALPQSAPSAMTRAISKALMILPAAPMLDRDRGRDADQRIMHEVEAFLQRHAEVVGEFQRRGAGAAFLAVDDDEVGIDPRLHHRLATPKNSHGWPMHSLNPAGLPPDSAPQRGDEFEHLDRRRERRVARRRDAIDADRHAAGCGDFRRDLGGRQHAAVTGLRALAELHLDHLHLVALRRASLEFLGAEGAVGIAAAEVA